MKVSVLINNFNYGRYLGYCLDSVFNQSYNNIEVILYDDGSTDTSSQVWSSFLRSNFKVISKSNLGMYPSINQANAIWEAFKESSGEIVCLLDSDDAFLPDKVQTVVQEFCRLPEVVLIQNKMLEIDSNNKKTGNIRKNVIENVDILQEISLSNRVDLYFMSTSGLSFRRSYLEKVLPLEMSRNTLVWPDVRLTRTALFYGKVFTLRHPQGEYRLHTSNDSSKLKSKEFYLVFESQHDSFFNELAERFGYNKLQKYFGVKKQLLFMIYLLRSKQPLLKKIGYIRRYFQERIESKLN